MDRFHNPVFRSGWRVMPGSHDIFLNTQQKALALAVSQSADAYRDKTIAALEKTGASDIQALRTGRGCDTPAGGWLVNQSEIAFTAAGNKAEAHLTFFTPGSETCARIWTRIMFTDAAFTLAADDATFPQLQKHAAEASQAMYEAAAGLFLPQLQAAAKAGDEDDAVWSNAWRDAVAAEGKWPSVARDAYPEKEPFMELIAADVPRQSFSEMARLVVAASSGKIGLSHDGEAINHESLSSDAEMDEGHGRTPDTLALAERTAHFAKLVQRGVTPAKNIMASYPFVMWPQKMRILKTARGIRGVTIASPHGCKTVIAGLAGGVPPVEEFSDMGGPDCHVVGPNCKPIPPNHSYGATMTACLASDHGVNVNRIQRPRQLMHG